MSSDQDRFLTFVGKHEREWGTETYKGRPTLKQIMDAKVVAFWYPTGSELPFTLTVHKDLRDIEAYVRAIVWHTTEELPRLRLARIFMDKKEVRIKDVKVVFDVPSR